MSVSSKGPIRRLHPSFGSARHALSRLTRHHQAAQVLVSVFYIFSVYISYTLLATLHLDARSATAIFQWPVAWIGWLEWHNGAQFVGVATFVASIACALNNESRVLRILFAVLVLMAVGLINSYGSVGHGHHIWVWLAFIFCFAPQDFSNVAHRPAKLGLLATIATAQMYILLTYSMAGTFKIMGGLKAALSGEAGNFSLTGFASQIADRSLQTGTEPLAAEFIISNPAIFAPLFWGLIFAQFFALLVIFIPRLHRTFGLILIGFHFGTWALMEIIFPLHIAWQLLFFVFSPFRPNDNSDSPVQIAKEIYAKALTTLIGVLKTPLTGGQPRPIK